jgi:spore coat protein A
LRAVAVGAVFFLAGHVASAAVVTLEPIQDTTIYQGMDPSQGDPNYEDNSCGAGAGMFTGTTADLAQVRRALLQFDIAGNMPPGAAINSVTLTATVDRAGDSRDSAVTLHPLTRAWGEGAVDCLAVQGGGGQGGDAGPGDATWLDARFQQEPWSSAGGDFEPASATAVVGNRNGNQGVWDGAGNPAMLADVERWLADPDGNHGWILRGDEARAPGDPSARRFSTREGSAPPQLVIDFTGEGFACCFEDGACSIQLEGNCTAQGGTPDLTQTSCEPNPCPQPVGACCNVDESCADDVARDVCEAGGGLFNGAGSLCSDKRVDCGLEPFVDALPIPPALSPVGTRADGALQYRVEVVTARQQLHRDLPDTDLWTYNGAYPSFTIEARVGEPIEVTYANNLPASGRRGRPLFDVNQCPHGPDQYGDSQRIVTHLHGGHVPARVDGQPELTLLPGEMDVYEYPNEQLPATLWYHDHALGITRLNVYAGMAGFYLLRDDFEDALGLPSGEFEIALAVQDREFDADGSLFYPPGVPEAFFGDKVLVNGKVWPFLGVKPGKYRFRFLNGSQARPYTLRLENLADPEQVIPFTLIGTDLGLISAPIELDGFHMTPGERFDVIVDFSGFSAGDELVLRNDDPTGPRLPNVMKFVVQDEPGFTGPIPTALRAVTPIPKGEASVTRWFRLENVTEPCAGKEWLIRTLDGPGGNPIGEDHWDDIVKGVTLGSTEIWEFENPSNIMHPMHVHLVAFQVLERRSLSGGGALPLDPWEANTWKDTVKVPAGTVVSVIARYDDYLGKFPFHCHILDHEDHEMMRQFQTSNDPAGCDGDGTCDVGEDCVSCPSDCLEVSGALCGNGLCEAGDGENCVSCPDDCAGRQKGSASRQFCCGADDDQVTNPIGCGDFDNVPGDDRCIDGADRRFCRESPRVLACCGDSLCEGAETEAGCGIDCPPPADCATYADRQSCRDAGCRWQMSSCQNP